MDEPENDILLLSKTEEGQSKLEKIRAEAIASIINDLPALQEAGKAIAPFNIKYHQKMQIHLLNAERTYFEVRNAAMIQEYGKYGVYPEKLLEWSEKVFLEEVDSIKRAKPNDFLIEPTLIPEDKGERKIYIKSLEAYQIAEKNTRTKIDAVLKKHGFRLEHEVEHIKLPSTLNNIKFRDDFIKGIAFPPPSNYARIAPQTPQIERPLLRQVG